MEEDEGLKIFVVMVREISKELKIFTQSWKQIEMSIVRGLVAQWSCSVSSIYGETREFGLWIPVSHSTFIEKIYIF